jgi:phosphoribosylglycinamide formyltransferase-1
MKLGVLISGRGSNMVSLAEACEQPDFPAELAVVVSNVPGAGGLGRAAGMGIPTAVVDHRDHDDRPAFERALLRVLQEHDIEAVALAGFMRIVTGTLLSAFPGRVLNIHPSLLPAFPGAHAHRDVLEYGVKVSGCTVHLVTEEMDAGPIVVQAAVPVAEGDTEDTLAARVLEQEHRIYPEAVRLLAEGRLRVEGRRVRILK